MIIPQKPSKVYDWINNVHKIIKPPNLAVESHNTIREKPKAFYKHNGYFSYFSEATRREREMNEIYARRDLSKFQSMRKWGSQTEMKNMWSRLKKAFKNPGNNSQTDLSPYWSTDKTNKCSDNTNYLKTNGWVNTYRGGQNSVTDSLEKSTKEALTARRSSNKI